MHNLAASLPNDSPLSQDEQGNLILQVGYFRFGKVGMNVQGNPSFDEWEQAGSTLFAINRDIVQPFPWWLGEWLAWGEAKWGERYAQAVDMTGLDYQTLANICYTARKVEPSRRRKELSFSHHQEVASLPPAEQSSWLEKAEGEGWSTHELRAEIRKEVSGQEIVFECPCCGAIFEVSRTVKVIKTIREKRLKR